MISLMYVRHHFLELFGAWPSHILDFHFRSNLHMNSIWFIIFKICSFIIEWSSDTYISTFNEMNKACFQLVANASVLQLSFRRKQTACKEFAVHWCAPEIYARPSSYPSMHRGHVFRLAPFGDACGSFYFVLHPFPFNISIMMSSSVNKNTRNPADPSSVMPEKKMHCRLF